MLLLDSPGTVGEFSVRSAVGSCCYVIRLPLYAEQRGACLNTRFSGYQESVTSEHFAFLNILYKEHHEGLPPFI
jgi:hypothetical protein